MAEIHDLVARLGKEQTKCELLARLDDVLLPPKTRERLAADIFDQVEKASQVMLDASTAFNISYSGFAVLSLPHKALPKITDAWERTLADGKFMLRIEPGRLPIGGKWQEFGVPFGSRARLIMLYLQTQCLLHGSRTIKLGSSLYEWLNRMGVPIGGPNYKAVKEQANRIRAATLAFAMPGQKGTPFKQDFIVTGGVIFSDDDIADPRQPRLWEDEIVLSETFYDALRKHPVPLNESAIRAISNESWAIDVYIWLCYRLWSLETKIELSWAQLRDQFGPGAAYRKLANFRQKFLPVLQSALAVYPEARVEVTPGGIILLPSPPAVARSKIYQVKKVGDSQA